MEVRVSRSLLIRIGTDFVALIALACPILFLYLFGIPFSRGFFCSDLSLRYPYQDSTISTGLLWVYSIIIPVVLICGVEYIEQERFKDNGVLYYWQLYCELIVFLFGLLASQDLTDIAKYSIGRLRPHFHDVCRPNVICTYNMQEYVQNFNCEGSRSHLFKDSRLSFMSGHASVSAYGMTYLAIYLQHRLNGKQLGLLKPFIQVSLLLIAIYTGFTRISDYKHHWSDVLFGWINGTSVALLNASFLAKLFSKRKALFYKQKFDDKCEDLEPKDDLNQRRNSNGLGSSEKIPTRKIMRKNDFEVEMGNV